MQVLNLIILILYRTGYGGEFLGVGGTWNLNEDKNPDAEIVASGVFVGFFIYTSVVLISYCFGNTDHKKTLVVSICMLAYKFQLKNYIKLQEKTIVSLSLVSYFSQKNYISRIKIYRWNFRYIKCIKSDNFSLHFFDKYETHIFLSSVERDKRLDHQAIHTNIKVQ